MKKIVLGILLMTLAACSSNPNKAEKIDTELKNQEEVGAGQSVGTNDKGEMVVQKKVRLASYLSDLQREVYDLETTVYGDESVGRSGLYGVLRDCHDQSRLKENGGDGKVTPPPTKDIKTAGEDMSIGDLLDKVKAGKVGADEQKQLVAVSDDFLLARIKRFEGYRSSYKERKEWFDEEIRKCRAELKEKAPATKTDGDNKE